MGEWRECDCIYQEKQGVLKGEPVGEVELIDCCPKCGSPNLVEIEDDLVPVA